MNRYEIWIVCGSRELENEPWMMDTLTGLAKRYGWPREVYHGAARGADSIAGRWIRTSNLHPEVLGLGPSERKFPADWDQHGKKAGFLRNQEMADAAKASGRKTLCVAFPVVGLPNNGTFDMVARAGRAGIPVYVIPCHEPRRA